MSISATPSCCESVLRVAHLTSESTSTPDSLFDIRHSTCDPFSKSLRFRNSWMFSAGEDTVFMMTRKDGGLT